MFPCPPCQLLIGTCQDYCQWLNKGIMHFPGGSDGKEALCSVGDPGSILGSGRSSGEGNGSPLHYSCLENPMDREAWWVTVHGVAKSRTWLSTHAKFPCTKEEMRNLHAFCCIELCRSIYSCHSCFLLDSCLPPASCKQVAQWVRLSPHSGWVVRIPFFLPCLYVTVLVTIFLLRL